MPVVNVLYFESNNLSIDICLYTCSSTTILCQPFRTNRTTNHKLIIVCTMYSNPNFYLIAAPEVQSACNVQSCVEKIRYKLSMPTATLWYAI